MSDPAHIPLDAIVPRLQSGELTSVALTEAYLNRIRELDGAVGAFVSVTEELALERARLLDTTFSRQGQVGALHGLPVALKDNIDTEGVRTTAGSAFFATRIPERNAAVAERLITAGAVIVGKTALHEFAFGATTQNPHHGDCRNPWNLDRIPGGSSGGSGAALGAGLCAGALGTDTGGSVRIPGALNGVTALRPTRGCVSARGVFPVSWTLDAVGPMARSAADVAALFEVVAGYDADDPGSVAGTLRRSLGDDGLRGLRVGVPRGFLFDELDPEVDAAVRRGVDALAALGAEIDEIEIPGAAAAVDTATRIILAEALAVHGHRLEREPDRFGEDVRRRLGSGAGLTGADYAQLRQDARVWRRTIAGVLSRVDVVLGPVTAIVAPPAAGAEMIETTRRLTRFTYGWSLAEVPAISLPCGFSTDGMPIGMQLVAAAWCDRTLLDVGIAYQSVTDWHTREPALSVGTGGGSG
jgi:aspartyl-tRNA(Asn)/glutamyl-tRNA(Gln) amidotransferase subunit A